MKRAVAVLDSGDSQSGKKKRRLPKVLYPNVHPEYKRKTSRLAATGEIYGCEVCIEPLSPNGLEQHDLIDVTRLISTAPQSPLLMPAAMLPLSPLQTPSVPPSSPPVRQSSVSFSLESSPKAPEEVHAKAPVESLVEAYALLAEIREFFGSR
jgi:hypothetical protein